MVPTFPELESTAADLSGPTLIAPGNIASETDVGTIFQTAIDKFGKVNVVINAAGTTHVGPIGEIEPSQWWQDYVSIFLNDLVEQSQIRC